jgi:hypothetical protein
LSEGITFQFGPTGPPVRTAWTAANSGDAFLVLDRNGNGVVDNGTELFGNNTPQPADVDPNGFNALAEYDKPENGGNGDGIIDNRDSVFGRLRLWIDANHDGISQPNELHTLPELGVFSLSLRYRESPRTDQFGNRFHYVGAVNPDPGDGMSRDGHWAYDVFFVTETNTPSTSQKVANWALRDWLENGGSSSRRCPGSTQVVKGPQPGVSGDSQ